MIKKIVKLPIRALKLIYKNIFLYRVNKNRNITFNKGLNLVGIPLIDIREGCFLTLGKDVTLSSKNRGYHLNMHSPTKIYADKKSAEIIIGDRVRIHGTCIHAYEKITIGNNCLIAANCQIFDGNGHDLSFENVENRINTTGSSRPIDIGNNVWIGANTVVLPGASIGDGSVISANSVVRGRIPSMVVAGGNPAVVIKDYSS